MDKRSDKNTYDFLAYHNMHWSRKDDKHIIVWTPSYETKECFDLERLLAKAGMIAVSREFDKVCGKTATIYKHR